MTETGALSSLLRQLELPLARYKANACALERRVDLPPRIVTHLVATLEAANGRDTYLRERSQLLLRDAEKVAGITAYGRGQSRHRLIHGVD